MPFDDFQTLMGLFNPYSDMASSVAPTPQPETAEERELKRQEESYKQAMKAFQQQMEQNARTEQILNNTFISGNKLKSAQDEAMNRYAQKFGGSFDPESQKMNMGFGGKLGMILSAMNEGIAARQTGKQYVNPQDQLFQKALADMEQQRQTAKLLQDNRTLNTGNAYSRLALGQMGDITKNKQIDVQANTAAKKIQSDSEMKQLQLAVQDKWKAADDRYKNALIGVQQGKLKAQKELQDAIIDKYEAEAEYKKLGGGNPLATIMAAANAATPEGGNPFESVQTGLDQVNPAIKATQQQRMSPMWTPNPNALDLGGGPMPPAQIKEWDKINEDLPKDKNIAQFIQLQPNFYQARQMVSKGGFSGLPDVFLLTLFAKSIDNGSVVRPSEFENAKKAMGPFQTLQFLFEKGVGNMDEGELASKIQAALGGKFLPERVKQDIYNALDRYNGYLQAYTHKKITDVSNGFARGRGFDAAKTRQEMINRNHVLLDDMYSDAENQSTPVNPKDITKPLPKESGSGPLNPADQKKYEEGKTNGKALQLRNELNALNTAYRTEKDSNKKRQMLKRLTEVQNELMSMAQ